MYQPGLVEKGKSCQELLGEYSHKRRAQAAELILLNEFVQVDAQELKNEAQVLAMDECISQAQKMVIIVLIELAVYQIEDRHFHHTLIKVCCPVLDDLDCDNLLSLQVLTLDDLTECSLAEDIQNEIAILMPSLLRTKYVVDVQDVIAVIVVEAIVLGAFARLGEDSAWVS